jgi:hypothetical protein
VATISKELLEDRLKKLEEDLNAIGGAIQDTRYWLDVIGQEETATAEATGEDIVEVAPCES